MGFDHGVSFVERSTSLVGWREGVEGEGADLNELSLPWFALFRSDEIIPVYHRDRSELVDLGLDKGVFVLLGRRDVGHCGR